MIALFDNGLRVSIKPDLGVGVVGLMLGMTRDPFGGVILLEDGHVTMLDASQFTVDWRYDVKSDRWVDENAQMPAQVDMEG